MDLRGWTRKNQKPFITEDNLGAFWFLIVSKEILGGDYERMNFYDNEKMMFDLL